jgi:hypothetical protein
MKDKVYLLLFVDNAYIYLIDEDNKTKMCFFNDTSTELDIKKIKRMLEFLNINYFEIVASKLPRKYMSYKRI